MHCAMLGWQRLAWKGGGGGSAGRRGLQNLGHLINIIFRCQLINDGYMSGIDISP